MSKKAYLTIDDSPSKDFKQKVDYLYKNNIPAIFYCNGKQLLQYPEEAIYAIEKGYLLANHGFNHPFFSEISLDECFWQIEKCDQILRDIYKKAGTKLPMKYFRFPYGDKGGLVYDNYHDPYTDEGMKRKNLIQDFLRSLGYIKPVVKNINEAYYNTPFIKGDVDLYWTYDVLEWSLFVKDHGTEHGGSLENILENLDRINPEKGFGLNNDEFLDIILMHDHEETSYIFNYLIDKLLEKNITFILPDANLTNILKV